MKQVFRFIVFMLVLMSTSVYAYEFRRANSFDDVYDAACRVNVPGARGSGTFIGYCEKLDKCLILTNYHVVTNNTKATVEFWKNGKPVAVPTEVVWRFYDASMPGDFAILAANPNTLEQLKVPYVALAGEGVRASEKAFVISAGCPKGSHVWSWKGNIVASNQTTEFQPAPYPGQSGSGIFEFRDGALWYVETLTWLVGTEGSDSARGGSIPVANLYRALKSRKFPASYQESADKTPFVAPSNYKEVSVSDYTLVEYSLPIEQCDPCRKALDDVTKIQDSGIAVKRVDCSTDKGNEIAAKAKVYNCPTFVLYNGEGVEIQRWNSFGHSDEIITYVNSLYSDVVDEEPVEESSPLPARPKTDEEKTVFGELDLNINLNGDSFESPSIDIGELLEDFRERPAVHESFGDVGFFEDSCQIWNNRKGKRQQPKVEDEEEEGEEVTPILPKLLPKKNEPEQEDSKLGDRLLGRVDNIEKGIVDKINGLISAQVQSVQLWWKAVRWTILIYGVIGLVLIVVLSNVLSAVSIELFKQYREYRSSIQTNDSSVEVEEEVEEEEPAVVKKSTTKKTTAKKGAKK